MAHLTVTHYIACISWQTAQLASGQRRPLERHLQRRAAWYHS